jgi:RNA polymerase sigma-70 factor (ECF subfamily)
VKEIERKTAMEPGTTDQHLSQIATLWTVVCQAHAEPRQGAAADLVLSARRALFERYGGAIRRYLVASLRDRDVAEELFQEFALQFVRGDFRRVDPERGRFRDYVKTSLYRMVVQQFRRLRKKPGPLPAEIAELTERNDESKAPFERGDATFVQSWKDELLARAWTALELIQQQTGQPHYTILRFRADHADLSSDELAKRLTKLIGKPLTAAGLRQSLHRARDKFADLLLDEVAHSLDSPTAEKIEDELIALDLLEYCRPALKRRGKS